jgi:hypothetical protein
VTEPPIEPPFNSSSVTRAVQTSLLPDVRPDKAIGRIIGSVMTGTNADVIAAVAPLYLTGSVCDVTYGLGHWWQKFRPVDLVAHDLDPAKGDGIDFTNLPEADGAYDAVCFDPPYLPQGGTNHGGENTRAHRHMFGLVQRNETQLWEMIGAGLVECSRVSRTWVLVKCMDYTNGGGLRFRHVDVMASMTDLGFTCHDLIVHHTGAGPGGHNIFEVKRARRHHSYLLVFKVRP